MVSQALLYMHTGEGDNSYDHHHTCDMTPTNVLVHCILILTLLLVLLLLPLTVVQPPGPVG